MVQFSTSPDGEEKKEEEIMQTVSPRNNVVPTLADARYFLSRVVPRGDDEAQRLSQAIRLLEKISQG